MAQDQTGEVSRISVSKKGRPRPKFIIEPSFPRKTENNLLMGIQDHAYICCHVELSSGKGKEMEKKNSTDYQSISPEKTYIDKYNIIKCTVRLHETSSRSRTMPPL